MAVDTRKWIAFIQETLRGRYRAKITRMSANPLRWPVSTIRKWTNAGWVLLLSRDTRARIHTLFRRYAVEIDSSVNREGCSLCSHLKNPPSDASKSDVESEKTAQSGGPKIEGREHGELGVLKTEWKTAATT